MDISRMLPIFGAMLLMLPLLWPTGARGETPWALSGVIIYVFAVWIGLVLLSAIFGYAVRRWAYHWIEGPLEDPDDQEAD